MKRIARTALLALLAAGTATSAQAGGAPKTLVVREGLTAPQPAVSGALKGLSGMERFLAAHDSCLDRLGYRQVRLTPDERKEFGALKGNQARLDYIVEFSRKAVETGRN